MGAPVDQKEKIDFLTLVEPNLYTRRSHELLQAFHNGSTVYLRIASPTVSQPNL